MVLSRLARARAKLINSQAEAYLEPGEKVIDWVRARPLNSRDHGFVFVTPKRCIVHWARGEDPGSFEWGDLEAWGVATEYPKGPILGLETADGVCFVQIRVDTPAMARSAETFIHHLHQNVPAPRRALTTSADLDKVEFHTGHGARLSPPVLTPWDRARRIVITVLGALMIIGALLIIPLPGPWSFLIAIAGFAVLAREYDWAKDALDWFRRRYTDLRHRLKSRSGGKKHRFVSFIVGLFLAALLVLMGAWAVIRAAGDSPRRVACNVLPHSEGSWLGKQCEDA